MTGSESAPWGEPPDLLQGLEPTEHAEQSSPSCYQGFSLYEGGVLFVRLAGIINAGAEANAITRQLSDAIGRASGKVEMFADCRGFVRYHSDVRTRYTSALTDHGSKIARVWVFADSKLVRMGATVAGLALRQLRVLDRAAFDSTLRSALSR
jgi:hypothetical protein